MTSDERNNLISGLREFADFMEAHPDLPIGNIGGINVWLGYIPKDQTHELALRTWATAFHTFEKEASDFLFCLKRSFGGLRVAINADRDKVCRKVKKMVEQTVWECPSSLLSDESVASEPAEEAVAG